MHVLHPNTPSRSRTPKTCCCSWCHQKRELPYAEPVEERALAPVPYRPYVFTIPRLIGKIYQADRLESLRCYRKRCAAREAYRLSYEANHSRCVGQSAENPRHTCISGHLAFAFRWFIPDCYEHLVRHVSMHSNRSRRA
ncbi:MAG: hypothetical protein A3G81_22060 [Betaproteobacteria bacterium RIFCSPLOWO2_12_FULL_65_14]|nr:MAG: hypothetical protein A3G81_22060 [Betaproteobacteria bacterium RIFCSPLOWO2_12_FULL_65_14]